MSTTPARGGRPSQDRTKPVTVRLTADEHAQLMEAVEASGRSASDLIRETAAGIKIHARAPAINAEVLRELSRWGNNLNQIAYRIHTGNTPANFEILQVIDACYQALEMLELRLSGRIVSDDN